MIEDITAMREFKDDKKDGGDSPSEDYNELTEDDLPLLMQALGG